MYSKLMQLLLNISRLAVWAGGGMMLIAAVMVTIDVLSRKILGITMSGSDEISGYLFAIATAWAFPYALLHRANVRIDALYIHFPTITRALLDLLGILLLAFFAMMMTWRAFLMVGDTWENSSRAITPLQTPLIVPQAMWLSGWILFCLTLAFVIYGVLRGLMQRDFIQIQALAGALSMEEEIEEETATILGSKSDA